MKYLITYCSMDHSIASNPFWHSCILLSQCSEHTKIEVVDNWGFYGLPATTRNTWLSSLKIKAGLDINMTGNHGMLKHEDLRFMDLGYGLRGVTFEVTQEQFTKLQERCRQVAANQSEAIEEIAQFLHLEAKPKEQQRIYSYEHHSPTIFSIEKMKARNEGRPPRLEPFEIKPTLTLGGPAINQSLNCKTRVVSLLTDILSAEQINRITENGKHPSLPRYSGRLEHIYLHSSGPVREHKKSSGETVYYRDLADEGVHLHWTLPPQEIETLSDDTRDLLSLSKEYCNEVKQTIPYTNEF